MGRCKYANIFDKWCEDTKWEEYKPFILGGHICYTVCYGKDKKKVTYFYLDKTDEEIKKDLGSEVYNYLKGWAI